MIKLYSREIEDPFSQDNFKKIEENINGDVISNAQWRFVELTFAGAVTNFLYPHHLNFIPRDILQTSKTGAGSITFNYSNFDTTNIDITTSGACIVRFLLGRIEI